MKNKAATRKNYTRDVAHGKKPNTRRKHQRSHLSVSRPRKRATNYFNFQAIKAAALLGEEETWILKHGDEPAGDLSKWDRAVLGSLARHASNKGKTSFARPSVARIAFETGLSARTIHRALKRLEEYELIKIESGQ